MMFRILGPIECTIAGERVDLGGEKPQTVLLALILAEGRIVTTDRLIGLVWGDNPPTKPNVTLRSYISHLRKLLEPQRSNGAKPQILVTRAGGYALEVAAEGVDARLFQQLAKQARAHVTTNHVQTIEIATTALGLWRTVELDHGPITIFRTEADALIDLRSEVQELWLRSLLAAGRHQEVVAEARPMIEADRYREPYREVLIIALYLTGRTAEALAEYQLIRSILADELGLDPGPTLQRLEHQILSNDQDLLDRHLPSPEVNISSHTKPSRPSLVGRAIEVEHLRNLLKLSDSRIPLCALTGEPGIGKTALANHVVEEAQQLGYVVAWGRCRQGGQQDTHRPWTTVLRDLLDPLDEATRQTILGPRAIDLSSLLPEQDKKALDQAANAIADPMALYDAVSQALIRLSKTSPILLVFEDLHWADIESIRLLRYATAVITGYPVRIITTWRTTEAISDGRRAELADLSRLAGPSRLALEGLSPESIGALYVLSHGEASPAGYDAELRQRTDGNPLFITELLRAGPSDAPVSEVPTIGEAIDRRILDLRTGSLELLTIGALCPAGFAETLLAKISGEPADQVLDRIEEAMAARVLEEHPEFPDRFRFTHALIAEQLSARASARRRSILHAQIGGALSETTDANAQLAYHFLAGASAGSAKDGARFALLAGSDSTSLYDHANAVALFERGLAVLTEHVPTAARNSEEVKALRIDLLIALAQSVKHFQHYHRSHDLTREGFELALSIGDSKRMTAAALVYAGRAQSIDQSATREWLGYWNEPRLARSMLSQCLERLELGSPLHISALISFTSNSFDLPEDERLRDLVDEAISNAEATGNDVIVLDALINKMETLQRCLSVDERRNILDQALVLSARSGAAGLEMSARSANLLLALDQGQLAEADEQIKQAFFLRESTADPTVGMMSESLAISLATFQGRFNEADDRLQTALSAYSQYGNAVLDTLGLQLAMLYREKGQSEDVISMLEWKLEGYPGPAYATPLALSLVHAGQAEGAKELLHKYKSVALLSGGESVLQFVTPAIYSELVDFFDDRVVAGELLKALALAENRVVSMVYGSIILGSGSLALGRMASLLGHHQQAETLLNQAQELHLTLKSKPYELRTSGALAALEAQRENWSESSRHLEKAAELADEIGMNWLLPFIQGRVERVTNG